MTSMFPPDAPAGVGDVYLVPDVAQGMLYIVEHSKRFVLCLGQPENHLPRKLLGLLFSADRHQYTKVDLRYAQDVDLLTKQYLPPGKMRFEPIWHRGWGSISLQPEELQQQLETWEESFSAPTVSLSKLIHAGRARPKYPKNASAFDQQASEFLVQTNKRDLVIDAESVRFLHALGLDIRLPRETPAARTGYQPPKLGVVHPEDDQVVGIVGLRGSGGFTVTRDGRKLHSDSTLACWATEEECIRLLRSPTLHDPSQVDYAASLRQLEAQDWYTGRSALHRALDGLRWLGWSEQEMQDAFDSLRPLALEQIYLDTLDGAEMLLERWCSREEDIPDYAVEGIVRDARTLLQTYAGLRDVLGNVDPGYLPDLERYILTEA